MKPDRRHVEYEAAVAGWNRARAVIAGEDAVKAAGELFLPRLDSQTDADYDAYRARASFYNATARTAAGYVGMIFRRAPFMKLPASTSGIETDFDMRGTTLFGYAKNVVSEVVHVGRAGTLVDWSETEGRAYASLYKAEAILNWRSQRVNGRQTLTLVALAEAVEVETDDAFETSVENRVRVLRLVNGTGLPLTPVLSHREREERTDSTNHADGGGAPSLPLTYLVEVWREVREGDAVKWELIERRSPKRAGVPLPFIPFVFHGPLHSRAEVQRPPLDDLIALNLDHYRLDADYKHGVHYTALPTVWAAGFEPENSLKIGSSAAWISSNPDARAGYLEFSGQGLETFERAMERDERLMAILGTRLLETQKREAETAEALQIRHAGEESILTTIATSLSESITQVLRFCFFWGLASPKHFGSPDEAQVVFELNTDFGIKGLSAQELQTIVSAWQAGAISQDTMLELFRKGEILPDGRSNAEEMRLVNSEDAKTRGRITEENEGDEGQQAASAK